MRNQHLRIVSPPARLEVAIYARVSSDQQAERQTIDSQLSDLQARASADGHHLRDDMLFVDNGHSGASLVRPALERLRDVVSLSALDVLYVHAPDRLARSYAHQVLLVEVVEIEIGMTEGAEMVLPNETEDRRLDEGEKMGTGSGREI